MADNIDDGSDSDSEIDDQTEALLKGFESDDDDEKVGVEGLKEGQEVPAIPKTKLSKTQKRQLEEAKNDEIPGVVYVGRIPHGFYENEMRQYFKQFGTIVNLRLSRNRKTGASKHYAFIQFETKTVADIVAMTMDNYLLFGHILKVKSVADEQLSPDIWKGANKRFKKVPWNKLEGRALNQGASEDKWEERITKEQQKRIEKADKLKAIGYEFEIPEIKSAKGVAKIPEITNGDEEVKAIEEAAAPIEPKSDAVAVEETVKAIETVLAEKPKGKGKKGKAAKQAIEEIVDAIVPEPAASEAIVDAIVPKSVVSADKAKGKKGKATKQAEAEVVEAEVPVIAETTQAKPKKEKKGKTVKAVVETITHEEIEIETPLEPAVEETVKPKAKKEKKPKASKVTTETVVEKVEVETPLPVEEVVKPKSKKEKKPKASKAETVVEEIEAEVAIEETKPKAKKAKKQKTVEVVAEVDVPAEVPEKKLKTKKSKTALVEEAIVPEEAVVVEKVKKSKKAKKESA